MRISNSNNELGACGKVPTKAQGPKNEARSSPTWSQFSEKTG